MTEIKGTVSVIRIRGTVQSYGAEISGRLRPRGRISGVAESQGTVKGIVRNRFRIQGTLAEVTNLTSEDVASGFVYITDVDVPGGTASNKTHQDPSDTVVQTAVVSSLDVRLSIIASYPKIDIGGTDYFLSRAVGESHYAGDIDITVIEGDTIVTLQTPDDANGAVDTVNLTLSAPPAITSLSFTGGYPGSQTELKENDSFNISVTADKLFDQVIIVDYEACQADVIGVADTLSTTVTATIADRGLVATLRPARVYVRDAATGAFSLTVDTNYGGGSVDGTDVVNCNNLYPTITWGVATYPGVQQALKGSEGGTFSLSVISNLDTVLFDSPTGELSITNPTTIEAVKSVTRISGTYNISTLNLRATGNRSANDATTISATVMNIAAVATIASVAEVAARLRSGGNDGTSAQAHTITISADQQLLNAPSMDPDSGGSRGTFIGSWVGGPTSYTRSLQVHDNDEKGTFTWENLVVTNLAGIITNTITGNSQYTLGGFVSRTVTWQAFQTISDSVNVEIVDFSKVQAGLWQATNNQSIKFAIGTPPPETDGYTSEDPIGTKPHNVEWLDTDAASSNTGTADLFEYEEVI